MHKERVWMDWAVGGAAVVISLASLFVAVREGQTQQRLLEASVWPFLQYETSDIPAVIQKIDFSLQNAGVGPAHLVWSTLYYKEKSYPSARAALRACCGGTGSHSLVTEYLQQRVFSANQTIIFIRLRREPSDEAIWSKFDRERHNFYLRGCYCSVLDQCWLLDSRRKEPAPMHGCPPAEAPVLEG